MAMVSLISVVEAATCVDIVLVAEARASKSASVASTVLRTLVNEDSKSSDALTTAVPMARTGVVTVLLSDLPAPVSALPVLEAFLPKLSNALPMAVHSDCAVLSALLHDSMSACVCFTAARALLSFVCALVKASAAFCVLFCRETCWPVSFLTSAVCWRYSSLTRSRLLLAAMVAESASPSALRYCL